MITIAFIAIIIAAAYFGSAFVKKNAVILYVFATGLSVLMVVFRNAAITTPFNQGYLGLAFFYVVMIVGLFRHESKFHQRLTSVRSQLSILGFIILTPHAIFYVIDKFALGGQFDLIGLLSYLVMVPLFITSFKVPEYGPAKFRWKKMQRFAYLAYLLIFVHLVIVSEMPNLLLYIVLFVPYFIYKPIHFFRYEKAYLLKREKQMVDLNQKHAKEVTNDDTERI